MTPTDWDLMAFSAQIGYAVSLKSMLQLKWKINTETV